MTQDGVPVPILIQNFDVERKVAVLRKRAQQAKVILPADVALFIAQNASSNACALEGALIRLIAHSSLTGTWITLKYTQRLLANFIAAEARNVAVDPLQELPSLPLGKKQANRTFQNQTAEVPHFVFLPAANRGREKNRPNPIRIAGEPSRERA